ncbi:MAG: hypothetical protein JXR50_08040 [Prolixibacteraceae bacterium]|nr:hypothetical protein [Prolixibacteraceae bacterium]MBN2649674.1 hypothetical protein [Prolixibacteraceae bacterium]
MDFASIKKAVIIVASSLFIFFFIHKILQYDTFATEHIIKNYENTDGNRTKIHKPYEKLTDENMLHWDAVHYNIISKEGYNADVVFLFAFFPLFPLLWKLTMLSPLGISILNYILFSFSVILLCRQLKMMKNIWIVLFIVNLPFITPFIIPYTEALFFFSITIAFLGFLKGNYWIYFIGAFFTAMTRSAITIVLLSLLATELLFLLKNKRTMQSVNRIFYSALPLIIGTLAVLIYQKISGAESLFTYVDAIKTWDRKLNISGGLRDWSHEGFGLSIATIFFVVPFSIYTVIEYIKSVFILKSKNCIVNDKEQKEQYLLLLSAVYTIGMFLTNILFQGGSINGLYRYILCTPFFFFQLFFMINKVRPINTNSKSIFYIFALFAGIFTMSMSGYSASWGFSDLGFILLALSIGILLFHQQTKKKSGFIFPVALFIFNVFWNTYLFNMYVCNGWIFT